MEINKDLLNDALSAIRRMANDLKAYRHAEAVIETFVAAQATIGDLTAKVAALKAEAETLTAKQAEDLETHRVRMEAFDADAAVKKAALEDELAGIQATVADAKRAADQKVADYREADLAMEFELNEARKRHEAQLGDLHREIAVKRELLDAHNAELAAARARLGG